MLREKKHPLNDELPLMRHSAEVVDKRSEKELRLELHAQAETGFDTGHIAEPVQEA